MKLGQWIGFLALVASLYILWQIRQVLLLAFSAVVFAIALNRLSRRLQQSGLKRSRAVLLSGIVVLLGLVLIVWLILPPFFAQFQQLIVLLPQSLLRLNTWLLQLRTQLPEQFNQYLPDISELIQQLQPLINRVVESSFALVANSLTVLVQLLLVLVWTMMLVGDPHSYRHVFVQLFPAFYRRQVDQILDQCEVGLGEWLSGILVNMTVIALLSWIGLLVLKVPLALFHAVLAGILTFIPNIGPVLSVVPPVIIALLDTPWKSGAVLLLYVGIQQIESNFLTPKVMAQQHIALLPALILIAQVFFGTGFGFLGLFLALPLAIVGQIWLRETLIKDVLDQWRGHAPELLATVPASEVMGPNRAIAPPLTPPDAPPTPTDNITPQASKQNPGSPELTNSGDELD